MDFFVEQVSFSVFGLRLDSKVVEKAAAGLSGVIKSVVLLGQDTGRRSRKPYRFSCN